MYLIQVNSSQVNSSQVKLIQAKLNQVNSNQMERTFTVQTCLGYSSTDIQEDIDKIKELKRQLGQVSNEYEKSCINQKISDLIKVMTLFGCEFPSDFNFANSKILSISKIEKTEPPQKKLTLEERYIQILKDQQTEENFSQIEILINSLECIRTLKSQYISQYKSPSEQHLTCRTHEQIRDEINVLILYGFGKSAFNLSWIDLI